MAQPMSAAVSRRGIVCMGSAMGCFVTNDALIRFASQRMPGTQLISIRRWCRQAAEAMVANGVRRTRRTLKALSTSRPCAATKPSQTPR